MKKEFFTSYQPKGPEGLMKTISKRELSDKQMLELARVLVQEVALKTGHCSVNQVAVDLETAIQDVSQ